ncbi:uncharacterized protein B0H18DRAFT_1184993 [Fomitopsis serialis]|uniref:uncharacterized protein n=1 Tax=Fomitopsis serialis TaxID=139415 RepID=UPI002007BCB9|nr:uncharacterized protein B0H18DRAFT_1184993 [Neoantrodia serialis]KAH9922399.1 hypothetical protein B0H18DRAFT_1184993 [Neoantrodia serialis]
MTGPEQHDRVSCRVRVARSLVLATAPGPKLCGRSAPRPYVPLCWPSSPPEEHLRTSLTATMTAQNGDKLEELVLSGKLFNPPSRSSSPVRSRSPSPAQWPTDGHDYDYDSDADRRRALASRAAEHESIGMGPGRTGVKGVIRDHAEAAALARSRRTEEIRALNRAMEGASLGGQTWAEEERARAAELARLEGKAGAVVDGRPRAGRFGHLMEVGVRSFDRALDEDRNTWVLVHIYDPSLDRCATLDETLSRLARAHPSTKFLHARAGAIGFATARPTTSPRATHLAPFPITRRPSRQILVPGRYSSHNDDDEDDPYGDENDSDGDGDAGWDDDNVDTDVLPTLLVYRGGALEHTWVRVDWEAKTGVEDLLRRHNILQGAERRPPSDEEDFDDGDLVFGGSDDDA